MSGHSRPKVLCVAGSPRRRGNSEQLLDRCIEGIADLGAEPDKLVAAEESIAPCRGCNSCSRTGECVIRDRMQEVYPRIDEAAAIVVASPVYFATVPATLKAFYDRLQPYWARVHVLGEPRPPRRPGAFLVVRGGGDPYGFDAALATTQSVFAVLGLDYQAELKVEGPDSADDINDYPDALGRALEIGREIASAAMSAGNR
jgi:multimeric flavodoxin WrbA